MNEKVPKREEMYWESLYPVLSSVAIW